MKRFLNKVFGIMIGYYGGVFFVNPIILYYFL